MKLIFAWINIRGSKRYTNANKLCLKGPNSWKLIPKVVILLKVTMIPFRGNWSSWCSRANNHSLPYRGVSYVKFLGKFPKNFSLKVSKYLFQSGLWAYIWSKMSLMRSIWLKLVKIGHFWSKWSKLGHFFGRRGNYIICQNLGNWSKNFFPKS